MLYLKLALPSRYDHRAEGRKQRTGKTMQPCRARTDGSVCRAPRPSIARRPPGRATSSGDAVADALTSRTRTPLA